MMEGGCDCNYKCSFMGMEEKEGSNVFVKRYFRFNQHKGRLQYYLDEPKNLPSVDAKPAGFFNMQYVSQVNDASKSKPTIRHCFSLTVQGRKHFFRASTDKEKNKWISVLKDAAKITVSTDTSLCRSHSHEGVSSDASLDRSPTSTEDFFFPCECDDNDDSSSDESPQFVAAYHSQHKPVKVGYCTKQGAKRKNWKRRYFILNQESLSYFHNKDDKTPIRSIELTSVIEVRASGYHQSRDHLFEILTDPRTFYIQAGSADEMQAWIGCINQCLQHKNTVFMSEDSAKALGVPRTSLPTGHNPPPNEVRKTWL